MLRRTLSIDQRKNRSTQDINHLEWPLYVIDMMIAVVETRGITEINKGLFLIATFVPKGGTDKFGPILTAGLHLAVIVL